MAKSQVVGIMNSPQVTEGNFNSPRVAKPQVVGIEIDLSDKWKMHHSYKAELLTGDATEMGRRRKG